MEKFSATISTEELKAKAKNANTTKSTSQWLLVCLSWTELRNKEQEIGAYQIGRDSAAVLCRSGKER